jgi:hypothetical protein
MAAGNQGLFCTGPGAFGDRFLAQNDLSQFQTCLADTWVSSPGGWDGRHGLTQGYQAIVNHLPRAEAPDRIRPSAELAIIYMSRERADEIEDQCGVTGPGAPEIDPGCLQDVVGPTIELLQGTSDPEGQGTAYGILSPPPDGCTAVSEVGQGYLEVIDATGGRYGPGCWSGDIGPTLDLILEDILARSSPLVLEHYPISASIRVAKDGIPLPRSRIDGFRYWAGPNTIGFVNQGWDLFQPSEVVVGYERWVTVTYPSD